MGRRVKNTGLFAATDGPTVAMSPIMITSQGSDDGLSAFLSVRSRLFGIAYRVLGCAAEAEDVVQGEALLAGSFGR